MVERININGTDVDMNNENGLSICIKNNILAKTADFSSCYSYTYDLPMTTLNKAVFGELLSVGNRNKRVRQYLDAEYFRDDYKIFRGKCYVSDVREDEFSVVLLFGVNSALQQIKDDGLLINELFNSPKDDTVRTYTADDLLEYKKYIPLTSNVQFAHYPFDSANAADTQVFALYDSSAGIATLTGSKLAVRAKRVFDLINERYGLEVATSNNLDSIWLQTAQNNRKDKFCLNFWRHGIWSTRIDNEVILHPLSPDPETNMANLVYGIDYDMTNDGVVNVIKHRYRLERVQLSLNISVPSSGTICYTNIAKQALNMGTFITPSNTLARWDANHTHIELDFIPSELGFECEFDATNTGVRETVYNCSAIVLIGDNDSTAPVPTNVTCLMTYSLLGDNVGVGYINSVDSLPSLSITQFLQDFLFGCNGEFIVNDFKGGKHLRGVNLETVMQSTPYDWSLKVVGTDIKVHNRIDGLAKKNHVKWAVSQVEAKKYYTIETEDTTIEEEEDFYTSNFGKMDGLTNFTYYGGVSVVPSPKIVREVFGQALRVDDNLYALVRNFNFDWIDQDSVSWQIMKKTLSEPTILELEVLFSSVELANLDIAKPVYLSQFGAVFLIKEITVTGEIGKVKLLQLKI